MAEPTQAELALVLKLVETRGRRETARRLRGVNGGRSFGATLGAFKFEPSVWRILAARAGTRLHVRVEARFTTT